MALERRTALASVVAAAVLIAIKLATGFASGSLAFIAEAAHSGTDLVAALLTFFAVGYARRPADRGHPYGHGKAEHLAALTEAAFLVVVSIGVATLAILRLTGVIATEVDPTTWAFVAVAVVLAIDISRTTISYRAARRFTSDALLSNALHFGSDLVGTTAVLGGLIAARAGWPGGDSVAALFVAVLVVVAASGLIRRNVAVLMDRAPVDTEAAARDAVAALDPPVELRRLRLRQAAGKTFADVVIGVSSGAAVGQGHAAADRVENALHHALPGSDIVVHVEPTVGEAALRERVRAAAMTVSHVREIHDLALLDLPGGHTEASLHLKLPGDLPLDQAHAIAEEVEQAILAQVPEIVGVQTHLEPLAERSQVETRGHFADVALIERVVREASGREPRSTRVLGTGEGLVVLLTLTVAGDVPLAEAHDEASRIGARVRATVPGIADVIVHTEP
jgi:cation diffusion facilitator family transporter